MSNVYIGNPSIISFHLHQIPFEMIIIALVPFFFFWGGWLLSMVLHILDLYCTSPTCIKYEFKFKLKFELSY